jgi:hypothetical protein
VIGQGLWINSQVSGLGGQLSLQTPNFIQNKDFTGETNIRAGITADKAYSLTWLNHSSGRAWGITADPSGTRAAPVHFKLLRKAQAKRDSSFGARILTAAILI